MAVRFITRRPLTPAIVEKATAISSEFGALLESKIRAGLKLEKRGLLPDGSTEFASQENFSTHHPHAFLEIVVCKLNHESDCDCLRYCFLDNGDVVRRPSGGKEHTFRDLQDGLLDLIHELPINKKPAN